MSQKDTVKVLQLSQKETAQLTQVLSNKTAQKIVSYLQDTTATESEMAKELNVPLSTIHYTVSQLVKVGLVKNDSYTYSQKGREVNHYALTQNHFIISAKPSFSISLLQQVIPATAVFASGLLLFDYFVKSAMTPFAGATRSVVESDTAMMMTSEDVVMQTVTSEPQFMMWFSVLFVIILFVSLLISYLLLYQRTSNRFKKK